MQPELIKDKSTKVLKSFFGISDEEPEVFVTLDEFSIELISEALSQSFVKGKQDDKIKN